ncbi:MAG: hypothetical protein ACRD96_10505 [Bryobacteraceae bacterium]
MAATGHRRIDERSRALHRAIAEKLSRQPDLLQRARENLDRWMASGGSAMPYWRTWQQILDRPLPEILKLLVEDSEQMTALRQSSPFAGILTPRERWRIYEAFGSRAHHSGSRDHRG